jgi:gas vesicle protein
MKQAVTATERVSRRDRKEHRMTVNLDIPILNRRLTIDMPQAERAVDDIGKAVRKTADDTSSRLSGMRLPQVDLEGAVGSARKTIDQAVKGLADTGDIAAASAERAAAGAAVRARHLGDDVDHAVKDIRSLRITRDRGRDPWPGVALILGAIAGVAAMFLFDPRDGRRRRTVLRDKLGKWGRVAGREARGKAMDLRNRSQGMIHEARSAIGMDEGSSVSEQSEIQPGSGATIGREPIAVAVGGSDTTPPAAGDYSDLSHEPGQANGRETNS